MILLPLAYRGFCMHWEDILNIKYRNFLYNIIVLHQFLTVCNKSLSHNFYYFSFQELIIEEYDETVGTKELTLDILSKLTWLEACIKESWRLYPVTPLIARQIYHPITICKYYLFKNIRVQDLFNLKFFDFHRTGYFLNKLIRFQWDMKFQQDRRFSLIHSFFTEILDTFQNQIFIDQNDFFLMDQNILLTLSFPLVLVPVIVSDGNTVQ